MYIQKKKNTDPEDDVSKLREPSLDEEIKNGQWMGVTVRSQGVGGKVSIYIYFIEYFCSHNVKNIRFQLHFLLGILLYILFLLNIFIFYDIAVRQIKWHCALCVQQ